MNKRTTWLFVLITLIYFIGVHIDVLDMDAAQYASMSREMLQRGDLLHVFDQGKDYLDKPPFIFWICSFSMRLFGISNFAYKLPSILFALLAIFSTYRFARLFYEESIATLAALVLATSQTLFLITQDCRTDTILMGAVIFSIWQWAAWFRNRKWIHWFWGSVGIGIGMLTKGPVALMVPFFGFGSDILLKRDFKKIFQPAYLGTLVIIALILTPMSIGLYQQFDLHPEKLVNGTTGVSGLQFFFWTQSFGRITGSSPWNNHAGFFFLLENMLWELLPWTFFFLAGLGIAIRELTNKRFLLKSSEEGVALGGFLLTYLVLAKSHYQLPHYIFVVFPLAAVLTARCLSGIFLEQRWPLLKRILQPLQGIVLVGLFLISLLILVRCFPPTRPLVPVLLILAFAVLIFLWLRPSSYPKMILLSIFTILALNIFLSTYFYPHLLKYEMGSVVGRYIQKKQIPLNQFYTYHYPNQSRSLSFYSQRLVPALHRSDTLQQGWILLTGKKGLNDLEEKKYRFQVLLQGGDYPVSLLSGAFLDSRTRGSTLRPYYLVKITEGGQ
ncbi:MAG: ArnT family glycosyltransferase [Chitinophagaceae bacterium]